MAVAFVVVVAGALVLLDDLSVHECLGDLVHVTLLSGIDLDAPVLQHVPRTVTDTSAEECLNALHLEEGGEGSVGVLSGIEDGGLSAVGVVYLELSRLSEVLEDISAHVCDCKLHVGSNVIAVYNLNP